MEQKRKKVRNTHTHSNELNTKSSTKNKQFLEFEQRSSFCVNAQTHSHWHSTRSWVCIKSWRKLCYWTLFGLYFVLLGEFFSAQNLFDCDKKYGKIIFRIRVTYSPDGIASIVVIEYHLMGFWYFAASYVRTLTALTPIWDSIFARNNLNSI